MEKISPEQIEKAKQWFDDHYNHVKMLMKTDGAVAKTNYPPCKEDISHPNLWKPGSWRWFINKYVN